MSLWTTLDPAMWTDLDQCTPSTNRRLARRIMDFYKISDDRASNEAWLDFFTPNAMVKIGTLEAKGQPDLRQMRAAMWRTILQRKHWIAKVLGNRSEQGVHVYVQGGVRRRFAGDREDVWSWVGSAVWVEAEGEWRMKAYRVWQDEWAQIDGPLNHETRF